MSCLHCLEAFTAVTVDVWSKNSVNLEKYFEICAEVFTSTLCKDFNNFEDPVKSKVVIIKLFEYLSYYGFEYFLDSLYLFSWATKYSQL